jgi:hypothetical protein
MTSHGWEIAECIILLGGIFAGTGDILYIRRNPPERISTETNTLTTSISTSHRVSTAALQSLSIKL